MKHTSVVALLAFFAMANLHCSRDAKLPAIRDKDDRIVVYHGINLCNAAKSAPDRLPWQTKEDFARLRDWGFNAVRYLVFWDNLEPIEGDFNETYLAATVERIEWMRDLGIDVLLDVHQDLFGAVYSGNGFPLWATDDGGRLYHLRQPWNANYLEPAVIAAYRNFWRSAALKEKYVAMLEYLMQRIEGMPNIAGIDVINEPYTAWLPNFERKILSSFYADMVAMRERNHFTTRLFFEPQMLTSAGMPTWLDFEPGDGCVFAPHYYDPLCHEGYPYTPAAKFWMKVTVHQRLNDARRFKTPLLFGEFGIAPENKGHLDMLADFLELADQNQFSWTYYSYDKTNAEGFGVIHDDGTERPQLRYLVRIYAQRIAGENPEYVFGEKRFRVTYTANASTAPTVVFIPAKYQGVHVEFNGHAVLFDDGARYLEVANEGGAGRQQTLDVRWTSAE